MVKNFPKNFSISRFNFNCSKNISVLRPFPPPLNLDSSSPQNTPLFSPNTVNIPHATIRELCPTSPSYRIKLTVYSARRLPLSFNSRLFFPSFQAFCWNHSFFSFFLKEIDTHFSFCRGDAVAPSTYLTVIGEDGRTLSSPVRAGTLHPEWNWTETFNVC